MCEIQLELNISNIDQSDANLSQCDVDTKLQNMQLQLDALNESMSKVRKKLFARVSELQKTCRNLEIQNQNLTKKLQQLTQERQDWNYLEGDNLFQLACS